jgi:hypothetical protein
MLKVANSVISASRITGVLPVVNGGTGVTTSTGTGNTVLSASPTLSGDVTLSTGNLIPSTAAKGVNFTANTPAAGMTSQLLNWYERGNWVATDGSGAGLTLTQNSVCKYTRIGNQVTLYLDISYPVTASASSMLITGIPFAVDMLTDGVGNIGYTSYAPPAPIFVQQSTGLVGIRLMTNGGATLTNVTVSTQRFQIMTTFFLN